MIVMIMMMMMMMTDERGADGVMTNSSRDRSTQNNPVRVLLCPHKISHDHTRVKHPDHRDGKPVTNCAIYGTAYILISDLPEILMESFFLRLIKHDA
jgi:hypothetical protein